LHAQPNAGSRRELDLVCSLGRYREEISLPWWFPILFRDEPIWSVKIKLNWIPGSQPSITRTLRLLFQSFLYSLIPVSVTALIIFLWTGSVAKDTFVLLMFLEGGIGLLLGVGISLSNSPSASKAGEFLFKTAPWSREAERHAESIGLRWITASLFLVLIGVAVSVI